LVTDEGLVVELVLPAKATSGQLVIARFVVRNDGATDLNVSARLRLGEGAVGLLVVDPTGRKRRVHGRYEVDSVPRQVTLPPKQRLATGLNLHATDAGRLFDQPGVYRVAARYRPSVHSAVGNRALRI
jgi:hypothetical protein